MKTRNLVCLAMLFCPRLFAQSHVDKSIQHIRLLYNLINNDSTLKTITLSNDEFDHPPYDGGEELTAYYDTIGVKKITVATGLSFGLVEMEYYFENSQLVFVYKREKHFARDSVGEVLYNKPMQTVFEGRFYFASNIVLTSIIKGKAFGIKNENGGLELVKNGGEFLALVKANISKLK